MRVLFAHGLEGSPQGLKARYLAARFQTRTPAMPTGDWEACLRLQREAVADFAPDVVVGSSFGAAVVVALLACGAWRGPTLLLAPAALRVDPEARLPPDVPVIVVHGRQDKVIPLEHARRLAATGEAERVRLVEVEDGHRLTSLLEGDGLADLVRQVHAMGQRA